MLGLQENNEFKAAEYGPGRDRNAVFVVVLKAFNEVLGRKGEHDGPSARYIVCSSLCGAEKFTRLVLLKNG